MRLSQGLFSIVCSSFARAGCPLDEPGQFVQQAMLHFCSDGQGASTASAIWVAPASSTCRFLTMGVPAAGAAAKARAGAVQGDRQPLSALERRACPGAGGRLGDACVQCLAGRRPQQHARGVRRSPEISLLITRELPSNHRETHTPSCFGVPKRCAYSGAGGRRGIHAQGVTALSHSLPVKASYIRLWPRNVKRYDSFV